MKIEILALHAFLERKGSRWIFEATHAANPSKLRQTYLEGFRDGMTAAQGVMTYVKEK